VTEQPEQVLPKERIAAAGRIEEGLAECAFDLKQHTSGNERRKCEKNHRRRNQHVPSVQRH